MLDEAIIEKYNKLVLGILIDLLFFDRDETSSKQKRNFVVENKEKF